MRLCIEVIDVLGRDARAGSQHEPVVRQGRAARQGHTVGICVDARHLVDDELDAPVDQRSFGPREILFLLVAKRDVHEARLVDVVTDWSTTVTSTVFVVDLALQLAGQEVGNNRAANPAAQDQDAVHRGVWQWSFSTTISS